MFLRNPPPEDISIGALLSRLVRPLQAIDRPCLQSWPLDTILSQPQYDGRLLAKRTLNALAREVLMSAELQGVKPSISNVHELAQFNVSAIDYLIVNAADITNRDLAISCYVGLLGNMFFLYGLQNKNMWDYATYDMIQLSHSYQADCQAKLWPVILAFGCTEFICATKFGLEL